MSTYVKITDFASKDALLSGNPAKIVKGSEIGAEFDALTTADASNVKGPVSAVVDNTVPRWDTTTGRIVQGSGVTISDADVVTASGFAGPLNGTVGATTPASGAFTTLSASGAATISAQLTASTGNGTYQIVAKDTRAYSAGVSGALLGMFGLDSTSANNSLAGLRALAQSGQNATLESRILVGGSLTTITTTSTTGLAVTGIVTPEADNTRTLGTGALRWSTVYAGTGTINTSDAREKTEVAKFTAAEINAAKQLSQEIGTYKFLASVAAKGDKARTHIGMTVQRAIEIMKSNGLDPFAYGFICHDVWEDVFVEHPAIEAQDATETTPAVEAKAAWTEQTQVAGDRYAFRYDQLALFIAAGIEARLAAAGI